MSTISCTRLLAFDAAHRVVEHESKCKYIHGHRYAAEITFQTTRLDALGRVIDFGLIKEKLGTWLEDNWDHSTILWDQDRDLGEAISKRTGQTIYYLPYNPTAENMARYLMEEICPKIFGEDARMCRSIRIDETPNCSAEYIRG